MQVWQDSGECNLQLQRLVQGGAPVALGGTAGAMTDDKFQQIT